VFVGQGYGAQVLMALAAERPSVVAGAVLLDGGPVSDPRALVRLRNNLVHLDGTRSEQAQRQVFRRMLSADYPGLPETQFDRLALRTHYTDKKGRVRQLFDAHLARMLEGYEHDDILTAQWSYFQALDHAPLLLMRTQLTEQLRREVFEEMMRRRRDADGIVIEGQGSPALLNASAEVDQLVTFVRYAAQLRTMAGSERAPVEA
jgi:pimeloyl-ACP methyl ester carboxylesterase